MRPTWRKRLQWYRAMLELMARRPFNTIEPGQWYAIGGQFRLHADGRIDTDSVVIAPMGLQRVTRRG